MTEQTPAQLRIVRVITRLNIGGPVRYLVPLDRGLHARGHQTLLVHGEVGEGEGSLEELAHQSGVPTLKIPHLIPAVEPGQDLKAFIALLKLLFRESPDVVHTHTAKAGSLGRTAAFIFNAVRPRQRRCIVVHTFEGHVLTGYFSKAGSMMVRTIERLLAHATDRVVTVSRGQRQEIVGRFAIAKDRQTAVISYGLDLDPLLQQQSDAPDMRDTLGISRDDVVVGFIGRLVPIKNLEMLISAFALATKRHPALWLVLAGDGPRRPDLEALVTSLGIAGRVRFLGWTQNLPAVYATFDICALTSLNEGTPVALIEAMAAERSVIATAVGGVPDVVEHERTGLLVPSGDTGMFADALVRLASDPAERARLAAAARPSVAARYSHERLVRDVEALYRTTIAEKRGARV